MAEVSGIPSNFEASPWVTPVDAVIFDMDGLMIDSEHNHYLAFKFALEPFLEPLGLELTEEEHKELNVGRSDAEGCRGLIEKYHFKDPEDGHEITEDELVQKKQAIYDEITRDKKPIMQDGLIPLLYALQRRGFKMAIASGSAKHEIKKVIEDLELEEFFGDHYYSAEEVERGKPASELFTLAAEGLGVDNKKCLVLEDANSGLKAAAYARMHRYVIPSRETKGDNFPHAYRIIHGLDQVMYWLQQDSPRSFKEPPKQAA